jgi:acyl-CoA synthetase (AMP-forming)/AMP-acid ligase II
MPEYFMTLDEIPLTPNGKMLKRAIVDWIRDGRVTPAPIRFEAKPASA